MKKQVHPALGTVAIVATVALVIFLMYKGTEAPPPVPMSPMGPGAGLLKTRSLDSVMTPEERATLHGHPHNAGVQDAHSKS